MGKLRTKEDILQEAFKIHGDLYDYSMFEYVNVDYHSTIICKVHGEFIQTPYKHLKRKQGCPECGKTKCVINKNNNLLLKNTVLNQPEEYKLIKAGEKYIKVSNCDFETLSNIAWSISHGYAYNFEKGKLHRFLLNPEEGLHVDHINRDKLDNRRENLRICTQQENSWNTPSVGKTSNYKGVYLSSKNGKWIANITLYKVKKRIGTFISEIEAAKAYDKKALELFGEFAYLNFPELKEEYLKT